MQLQFDKVFWELVRALPKKSTDITPAFTEEFSVNGADINIVDRNGSSYLETSIWNSTFTQNNRYYKSFSMEILYFLLFQDSLRPTITTVHVAASVCRDAKITEEILKRCDDALLRKLRGGCSDFFQAFDFLDPPIIEVFKGFRLK
jgi:hypothetical protein